MIKSEFFIKTITFTESKMLSLPKVLMMLMLVGALMLSGTLGGFDAPVYGADKNNVRFYSLKSAFEAF